MLFWTHWLLFNEQNHLSFCYSLSSQVWWHIVSLSGIWNYAWVSWMGSGHALHANHRSISPRAHWLPALLPQRWTGLTSGGGRDWASKRTILQMQFHWAGAEWPSLPTGRRQEPAALHLPSTGCWTLQASPATGRGRGRGRHWAVRKCRGKI